MDTSLHTSCYTVHLITYLQFYLLKYNTLLHIFNSICLNASVTTNCCLHPPATKKKWFFFSLFLFQTFKEFLKEVVNMNMKLWKFSKSQPPKVLGFGKYGRTLFKTIAKLVIAYHKKRKFSIHLLGKLRFFPDLRVKHPFDLAMNFIMARRKICYIWGIILWVLNYFSDFFFYIYNIYLPITSFLCYWFFFFFW